MDTLNVELTGVIVEAVGAAGIIVTLLYLARETGLQIAHIRSDSLQASIGGFVRQIRAVSEFAHNSAVFRQGLHDFLGQDVANQNGFHAMMLGFTGTYGGNWGLHKAGSIDEYEFIATQRAMVGILRSPGARDWWEDFKTVAPRDFVAHIDKLLSDQHPDVNAWSQRPLYRLEH